MTKNTKKALGEFLYKRSILKTLEIMIKIARLLNDLISDTIIIGKYSGVVSSLS